MRRRLAFGVASTCIGIVLAALYVLFVGTKRSSYVIGSHQDSRKVVQVKVYGARGRSRGKGTIEMIIYDNKVVKKILEKRVRVASQHSTLVL